VPLYYQIPAGATAYLALKFVFRKRRRLLSKDSFVGTTFFDDVLVQLVEPQVVDKHVERHAHRTVKVSAALIVVEQGVERVSTALEEVLTPRRVVVVPAAAGVAEQRAGVTGKRRPSRLEAQTADVDGHSVVLAQVLRVGHGRRSRRRRRG